MSLTPVDIVTMLERDGALAAPKDSPWPTHDGDVAPVEWGQLFPRRGRGGIEAVDEVDEWEPDLGGDFLEELNATAGSAADESDIQPGTKRVLVATQPDVCAWYQQFHFHGLDWGIFIKEDCLLRLALEIAKHVPFRPRSPYDLHRLAKAVVRAGFSTLFLHEQYHHKTESYGIRLHVVERVPRYVAYFQAVYGPLRSARSNDLHEEALANADSYLRLTDDPYNTWLGQIVVDATRRYLKARFPYDPPGYSRAIDFLKTVDFDKLEFLLKSQVQEGMVVPFRSPADWLMAPRINQSFDSCQSDIWTIVRPGARRVLPTSPPYPAVSTIDIVKALRKIGYKRTPGGKGSHIKLAGDDVPTLILPGRRKDLSPVVLRNIAKALGYRNPTELLERLGM
jgi:predicted RNA binding protein YcfA (HicA-like mRNA interferase family)